MKIAVFHNLPSGGAKRALYGFVKYLTKSGHFVDVFVPSTANENFLPLKEIVNKVNIFPIKKTFGGLIYSTFRYIPPIRMSICLRDLEKTEKKIAYAINGQSYNVVFSEQDQYTLSPFFLKFIKKPTVYYCQQPSRSNEVILQNISQKRIDRNHLQLKRRIWHKYLASRLLQIDKENALFSKYILTNSYFSRESILKSYGLNSFVSYLGIDTKIFKHLDVPKENFVLSVGSCGPAKGFDFIINSLGYINSKKRPKFIIVSNSVDIRWKDYLEQLAIKVGVNLEVKNLIQDNELVLLYNKAKLLLYAPYLEPFGLVPLEAMACGTPVIAVREGGARESIAHNETGILTERDESMFSEAVIKLLDKSKRQNIVRRSIEVIHKHWTIDKAGERLLKHLNRAIEILK
ncbi:D-inositol-3-phosphate glycosyltransferase [subsurface metagenome]